MISTAIFEGIEITNENQGQDIIIEFDWIFQGNQADIVRLDLDIFSLAVVGTGANPVTVDVDLDGGVQVTNSYAYKRNNSFTISGGLPIDSYTIQATLVEATDIALVTEYDHSAVGLGNISARAVPFEFSPALGLLLSGMCLKIIHFWQRRKSFNTKA